MIVVGFYAIKNFGVKETIVEPKINQGEVESEVESEVEKDIKVKVLEDGFNKKSVSVSGEGALIVLNDTQDKITLIGDLIFIDGKEIGVNNGVGIPMENFSKNEGKEMNFWLAKTPDQKLKITIK